MHRLTSTRSMAHRPVYLALLALGAFLFAPAWTASALSVSIDTVTSIGDLDDLRVGDEISIGVTVRNDRQDPILAFGIEAFDWDTTVLSASRLELTESFFNTGVFPLPDGTLVPFGGIRTTYNGPIDLTDQPLYDNGLFFAGAASLTSAAGTGEYDLGVDGFLVGEGDVHARLTFSVVGEGSTTIYFGGLTDRQWPVVIEDRVNPDLGFTFRHEDTNVSTIAIRVGDRVSPAPAGPIPEPTGALLFSAALMMIARIQRRY